MEKITKSSSISKPTLDGPFIFNGDKKFGENKTKFKKKEVNSWDCSTPTSNEKMPKDNISDWDSSSDCQETMVEPFEPKTSGKDYDDWDTESEKKNTSESEKKNTSKTKSDKKELEEGIAETVSDSLDFSIADLSDKSSSMDISNLLSNKKNKSSCVSKNSLKSVEDLTIEDLEDFEKDNSKSLASKIDSSLNSENEKVKSKNSEDTTIWMIPKSERSLSTDSTSKINSTSDRMRLENCCNYSQSLKKAKSFSSVQKSKVKKKSSRCTRSDIAVPFDFDKNNNSFYENCEGFSLQKKLEKEYNSKKEEITVGESFDRTKVFFTEYECRTMTLDEDKPPKMSPGVRNREDEDVPENADAEPEVPNNEVNRSSEHTVSEMVLAGPSAQPNLDVVSLPDMTGRKAMKEKMQRRMTSPGRKNISAGPQIQPSTAANQIESWFFLDGTGQYQAVTRNEVSILLNGRSADTVLQGQKEHVIPNVNIKDPAFPQNSISGILTKESLQYFLREEDVGGEDGGKIQIDLERKIENTLLYIQPNMNLTASIRIIPVDTDMVHLWRRTRDTGSLISSEVDLRLHSPQDSIENNTLRNPLIQSSFSRRIMPENHQQTVDEIDEVLSTETLAGTTQESSRNPRTPPKNLVTDYNSLLLETRTIVDSLTKNFKIMQTRLDGETNRSLQLQGEVNKLRNLLKSNSDRNSQKKISRENINEHHLIHFEGTSSVSLIAINELKEKKEPKNDNVIEESFEDCQEVPSDAMARVPSTIHISYPMEKDAEKVFLNTNGFVTVNIYTMETQSSQECIVGSQETNSLLQENLGIIERKMKRLQDENDTIGRQNMELKKKLKEISQELEKYLGGASEAELRAEEDEELDTLRDQVCNLKLELDNLKTTSWNKEEVLSSEKSALLQKLSKELTAREEWCATASEVFLQIQKEKNRLVEIGLEVDVNTDLNATKNPKTFLVDIVHYLQQVTELLITLRKENYFYDETLKQSSKNLRETSEKDILGLDQVISGYTELIEQCRKGSVNSEIKVMEDYFTIMMEKVSLNEEIKILKTENEMLLESQLEHYEKLKQTMIALKDRKTEIIALESSQKLSEEEKDRMKDIVKNYEDEKMKMEAEISKKNEEIEKLKSEKNLIDKEIKEAKEKLKEAANEIMNFEKSFRAKEEYIKELQNENDQLVEADRIKTNQMEILEVEMKQKTELESELISTKIYLTESQKEMTEYVTNLETVINNTQDTLDKTKQKLKESNQIITRLKTENELLDKQHGCDLKLYNSAKDELECCKENLKKSTESLKELEDEKEKLQKNVEALSRSEKEKAEAIDTAERQYKLIVNENLCLKEKIEIFSRDKEESVKEQKDLINKYGMLSKEIQKLQEKYRNVKMECNERTGLIKYLESMLKENILEYNSRIACLEKNISKILEKIAACKSTMKEKHFGDGEVKELRHQLDVTYQERRELESVVENYYTLVKHLENEIEEREKKMVELHEQVSLGQQKAIEYENNKILATNIKEVSQNKDCAKVEELELQLATTEKELLDCKKNLQNCQMDYESEKKKSQLIIADLNSEIKRYQLRIEVMMRNISTSKLSLATSLEKRLLEDKSILSIKREIEEKDRKIQQLNDTINNCKTELEMKNCDLDKYKRKSIELDEELKNVQNQFVKLQDTVSATKQNNEMQQKEREEMGEKLLQSIKLVMEERSARQTLEMLAAGKEKSFNEQTEGLKNALIHKEKEYEILMGSFEEKKKLINKLQDVVKKLKSEVASLKVQINSGMKNSSWSNGSPPFKSTSLNNVGQKQINYKDRLESCATELKEVRECNLQLRKTEGQYQAKIIRLEDEIRDARLLIKELQGDIKTERKSKNALKDMISSAKMELEKCLLSKQLVSAVAERINRHLDLREIPSRELLSGFRISDNSHNSPLPIYS